MNKAFLSLLFKYWNMLISFVEYIEVQCGIKNIQDFLMYQSGLKLS
jgi:hypothetical protein